MSYTYSESPINRQRRQAGGGGLMFWGAVMPNGLIALRLLKGNQNAEKYIELLRNFAVPIMNLNMCGDYRFIQDNAIIHKAVLVSRYLENQNFKVMDWPAKSPDLNLTENIWKMISDIVYQGEQFKKYADLEENIWSAVTFINENKRHQVKELFANFRCRLTKVLICGGNLIN